MMFLKVIVSLGFIIGLYISYRKLQSRKFSNWLNRMQDVHNYDEDSLRTMLTETAERGFVLSHSNLPYGRAKWFVESSDNLRKLVDINDLEYFGYTPIRSQVEQEFVEYGLLLTQDGIFYKYQEVKESDEKKSFQMITDYFPFDGLWKIKRKSNQLYFYYPTEVKKILIESEEKQLAILNSLNKIIQSGYTADLYLNVIQKEVSQTQLDFINNEIELTSEKGAFLGGIIGLNQLLQRHLKSIQFNPIAGGRMGHGYAAEYANNVVDKVKYPFQDVRQISQDNQKNGADRLVGHQKIQTKYNNNARNTINAAFEKKIDGGLYRYKDMQLEVPKDQYNEAVQLMKDKIKAGKVPGHTDPKDAYQIIRKGNVTYNEAKLIAKGGNITSLKYDALDGAVQSLPAAGISFVIVFAQAKWAGHSTKDSASLALRSSVRTLVVGTIVYASSQQIGKLLSAKIIDVTGKKVAAQMIARRAAGVVSLGLIVGPDLFDALTGRISSQQLLKNSLVAGSGVLGGALAGAAAGSILPIGGNILGAVIGATVATIGAKTILDNYIEDDRVEMFAILKEEFIDIVMSMTLSDDEFKKIQELVFDNQLGHKLKEMYRHEHSSNSRSFTREKIIESAVEKVISKRSKIDDKVILDAVEFAENEFMVYT